MGARRDQIQRVLHVRRGGRRRRRTKDGVGVAFPGHGSHARRQSLRILSTAKYGEDRPRKLEGKRTQNLEEKGSMKAAYTAERERERDRQTDRQTEASGSRQYEITNWGSFS